VYTPMASSITTTRTIRITNETAEYFKEKPLNRAVESLYGLLTDGTLTFDGDDLKVGCVHQNQKNEVENGPVCTPKSDEVCTPKRDNYELIAEMATLMRVDIDKVLRDIRELLESGELYYSNGTLRNSRYEEFENLCEAKHVSVEKVLLKVMREI